MKRKPLVLKPSEAGSKRLIFVFVQIVVNGLPQQRQHVVRGLAGELAARGGGVAAASQGLGDDLDVQGAAGAGGQAGTSSAGGHNHSVEGWTGGTGGGENHDNMPPYMTVYIWKRIS